MTNIILRDLGITLKFDMNRNFYCVIMAGGMGTRFWPMSRNSRPKQFLSMEDSGSSFLRNTYDRFSRIVPEENIIVVTADRFKGLVMEQLPDLKPENILLEPYARDTAPCIAYATYTLLKRNPNATMVVTPADHYIADEDVFVEDVRKALDYTVGKDILMTLGITPTRPDPNYGYIQVSGGKKHIKDEAMKVKTFTEKPDVPLAKVFMESGEFFWNSGIFLWKAETIREELERYLPEVTRLFAGWENAIGSSAEREFIEKAYTDCIKISIDYGVMERTERAWIYQIKFKWADIGNWESLYNSLSDKDIDGNACTNDNVISEGNIDTLIVAKNRKKLMAIKGLKDFIVVDTDDVLLICPKDDKKFKQFISELAMPGYEDYR